MTSSGRAHDILAKLIVSSATNAVSLPEALCASCASDLPMTGAAMVLQSSAGLDRVVAAGVSDRLSEAPGLGELSVRGVFYGA